MAESKDFLTGRLMVVAFEGWNDAGEAASAAVRSLKEQLDLAEIVEIDSEDFFDYQFNRPTSEFDDEGQRILVWPNATIYGPSADADSTVFLLLGTEPSRNWKRFTSEVLNVAVDAGVSGIVLLGAMLADVPHTRPISIYSTSENDGVRTELELERSTYEGPVGILSILSDAAEQLGIPTVSLWASVPHYVHNAPSPKATLALIDRLEELIHVVIPRGDLLEEAAAWESGIDALAGEDEEMASYIQQLEQARDTVDSPEASGEAIAQEFERYLRKRGDGPAAGSTEPWRP
ncbi:carboxylate--amine ligase [Subtercola boreus]|uniref:Carboxylate--amine ligase n=1 Tax=Subtercola boreus TaxID=120213 RepID=A0A3E0VHA3_9MICO|nr:PAC2 family protein [Subtercola boreus]RFA09316.1 carboxylate--amine ligase [Subtercola boreus]TQL53654.1 putative ATP-grasp superfamily ATP-dependent carboligase [Subtercola boreus]